MRVKLSRYFANLTRIIVRGSEIVRATPILAKRSLQLLQAPGVKRRFSFQPIIPLLPVESTRIHQQPYRPPVKSSVR
jgi:hypothetical protein